MKLHDRRLGNSAVPSDLYHYLNADQVRAYKTMQGNGWHMYFIRRPLFQIPTAVMINDEGTNIAMIEQNGYLDAHTRVGHRN